MVRLQVVDRIEMPRVIDKLTVIERPEVSMALGEYEPLAVLITSSSPLTNEALRFQGLPKGVDTSFRIAEPYRRKLRGAGAVTLPYLLQPASTISFREPGKSVYWITFHAAAGAKRGTSNVKLRVRDASLPFRLVIHPFRLRRDPSFFYGGFCGGKETNVTPAHLKDLHERGFDALQFFWGSMSIPITNDGGRMVVDFSTADRWMSDFKAAGMKGPVVWSMGNYASTHMENELSRVFDIPRPQPEVRGRHRYKVNISDIHNPELNRRLKELMLAIRQRAAEQKWPELLFIIYDEPTMALMPEYQDRYKFLKSFWPDLRIYGVTMDKLENAEAIQSATDVFSANGDFDRIRELGEKTGKPFWLYGSASSQDEASLRHHYAWSAWAHRANSAWFWAYNYHAGDPYDDFDDRGADSTMSMVWPSKTPGGAFAYSVSWDGMREAVDDMAYIQTLEWMLAQSKTSRAGEIRTRLEEIRKAIPTGKMVQVLEGKEHDKVAEVDSKRFVTEARTAVTGWIEELLRSDKNLYRDIRK